MLSRQQTKTFPILVSRSKASSACCCSCCCSGGPLRMIKRERPITSKSFFFLLLVLFLRSVTPLRGPAVGLQTNEIVRSSSPANSGLCALSLCWLVRSAPTGRHMASKPNCCRFPRVESTPERFRVLRKVVSVTAPKRIAILHATKHTSSFPHTLRSTMDYVIVSLHFFCFPNRITWHVEKLEGRTSFFLFVVDLFWVGGECR